MTTWLCISGTPWPTRHGAVAAERLRPGDIVACEGDDAWPVRWVGRLHLPLPALAERTELWPVHIAAEALGPGLPAQDITVLPQQPLMVEGFPPVAARWLVDGRGLARPAPRRALDIYTVALAGAAAPLGVTCIEEDPPEPIDPSRPDEATLHALRRHIAERAGWREAPLDGSLDEITRPRVSGWVAEGAGPVAVELVIDGEARAPVLADGLRPDLLAGGIGDGMRGFAFDLDPPLDPRRAHVLRVRRAVDGVDMPGSPALVQAAVKLPAALDAFADDAALEAAAGEAARWLGARLAGR